MVVFHKVLKSIIFSFVLLLISCGQEQTHNFSKEEIEKEVKAQLIRPIVLEKESVKLIEVVDIPPFEGVSIQLLHNNVSFNQTNNRFEFDIKKFNLGEKTIEELETGLKLNALGQYLKIFKGSVNNDKYYSGIVEQNLSKGENYLLAYLCRSYGVSLKSKGASVYYKIDVNQGESTLQEEKKKPVLLINSPKKNEIFNKKSKILLDFFIVNLDIGKGGNYLKVSVNDVSFNLYKWSPFVLTGLDYGKHKIKVSVCDKKGNSIIEELTKEVEIEIKEISVFE